MIHLIWKGKGWQIALLIFGCSLVAELLTRVITGDETYYQRNPYPLSMALIVASVINFMIVNQLDNEQTNSTHGHLPADRQNRPEVHSLFFIPIQYWPWILLGFSALNFVLVAKK